MKRIALTGALLALAVPATASAQEQPTPRENAAKACKELRSSMTAEQFKATYGTNKNGKNAFGKCVSTWKKAAVDAKQNAAKDCKAEREDPNFAAAHEGKTFEQHYGTNKNGKNAYGKCVSSKSKEELDEEVEATENAAKACKAERDDPNFAASHDGKTFAEYYGTNANRKNAFGKCVSTKAKEQGEQEQASEEPQQS